MALHTKISFDQVDGVPNTLNYISVINKKLEIRHEANAEFALQTGKVVCKNSLFDSC